MITKPVFLSIEVDTNFLNLIYRILLMFLNKYLIYIIIFL